MSKSSFKVNFNDDFQTVLVCAERYALGRKTYMSGIITEYITPFVPYLSDTTLGSLERDISGASNYGDEKIDKPLWLGLLDKIKEESNKRKATNSEVNQDETNT